MEKFARRNAKFYLLGSASAFLMAAGAQAAYAEESAEAANDDLTLIEEAEVQTAQAAQAQAQAQVEEELEEIVVTGSRLAGTNITSPVPVVQVGSEEIEARGVIRVEDMLNILPSVIAGQTSEVSNGATGTSNLNLRGLGATRTLVLIDGKRLPFGSSLTSPANLDIIPSRLVERVDIVTGGASAVYGSDAVAGVANFILKRDFEGVEIDGQVGFNHNRNNNSFMEEVLGKSGLESPSSNADGRDVFATLTLGSNTADNKGNVTAFISYQNQNTTLQGNRDISACALFAPGSVLPGDVDVNDVACVGSSNFRRFTPTLPNEEGEAIPFDVFQQDDGTLVPFVNSPDTTFNFGPPNFFQRPSERFTLNGKGHYEITDNMEVFADLTFMNNNTDAQIAPSATFNRPLDVNCNNPLLFSADTNFPEDSLAGGRDNLFELFRCDEVLAARDQAMAMGNANFTNPVTGQEVSVTDIDVPFTNSFRNVEGDPRSLEFDVTTWRIVTGFRGSLMDTFDWELFGQFSRTVDQRISTGDLNIPRVQDALFVIEDPTNPGNLICDPARDPADGCVPFNIFDRSPEGNALITQEAIDFVQGVGIVNGKTEQQIVGGTIQGDLTEYGLASPFAQQGVSALLGWEYRQDKLSRQPDDISQISGGRGLSGVGGGTLPVEGKLQVAEIFMETQIPIVQDKPFLKDLSLNGAYRRSFYTTKGQDTFIDEFVSNDFGTDTFFVGGSWTPTNDIRLRAQFQRTIRAPTVIDLFTGANTGLFGMSGDPCAGANPERTLEECARTGVTPGQFGNIPEQPAQQFNLVSGGNSQLEPEVSDTITLGGVFTPRFVPGLSIAVDYFNIEIEEAIGVIPPATSVTRCLDSGDPRFCDLIQRDRFGSLFLDNSNFEGVRATNVNIATLETKGVDINAQYSLDLNDLGLNDLGSLNFDYNATVVTTFENIPLPGANVIDCKGKFDSGTCTTPQPEYAHRLLTTWNISGPLQLTTTWRFVGSTDFNGTAPSPIDEKLESRNYLDLVIRYQMTDNLMFRLGSNNLLGKDAPITTQAGDTTGNGNTFPGVFDVDRFIFFGVNIAI